MCCLGILPSSVDDLTIFAADHDLFAADHEVHLVPAIAYLRDLVAGLANANSQHIAGAPLFSVQSLGACAAPSREFPELCVFTCRRDARDDSAIALCVCVRCECECHDSCRASTGTIVTVYLSLVSTCN